MHNERPAIVRCLEYIIGRVKGYYLPPINAPYLPRSKTNSDTWLRDCSFTHELDITSGPKIISNSNLDLINSHTSHPMMHTNTFEKLISTR